MNNLNTKELYSMALKLAIPIMIQNLINTLVNTADTIMLGQIISVVIVCLYLKNKKRRTDIYEQTNEKHIIDDCQRIFSSWWINSDFNSDS